MFGTFSNNFFIRFMSLSFPEFKNYYMGFYIHGNDKMEYKGNFSFIFQETTLHINFYVLFLTILSLWIKELNKSYKM
jgi:arginyl-tRNA--protein-N-Asp/Glu arginylyltransferase